MNTIKSQDIKLMHVISEFLNNDDKGSERERKENNPIYHSNKKDKCLGINLPKEAKDI